MFNQQEYAGQQRNSLKRTHFEAFKIQHREESYGNKDHLVFASNGQDAPYVRTGVIRNEDREVVQEVLHFDEYMARASKINVKISSYLNVNLMRPFYAENAGPNLTFTDVIPIVPAIVLSDIEPVHAREEAYTFQHAMRRLYEKGEFSTSSPTVTPEPLVFEMIEPSESSLLKVSKRPRSDMHTITVQEQTMITRSENSPFRRSSYIQKEYSPLASHSVFLHLNTSNKKNPCSSSTVTKPSFFSSDIQNDKKFLKDFINKTIDLDK